MFTGYQLSKCYVGMHFAGDLQFPSLAAGVVSHEDVFALSEEGPSCFPYQTGEMGVGAALAPQLQTPSTQATGEDADDQGSGGVNGRPAAAMHATAANSSLRCLLPRRQLLFPSPSSPDIRNAPVPLPVLAQTAKQRAGRRGLIQTVSRAVANVGYRLLGDSAASSHHADVDDQASDLSLIHI